MPLYGPRNRLRRTATRTDQQRVQHRRLAASVGAREHREWREAIQLGLCDASEVRDVDAGDHGWALTHPRARWCRHVRAAGSRLSIHSRPTRKVTTTWFSPGRGTNLHRQRQRQRQRRRRTTPRLQRRSSWRVTYPTLHGSRRLRHKRAAQGPERPRRAPQAGDSAPIQTRLLCANPRWRPLDHGPKGITQGRWQGRRQEHGGRADPSTLATGRPETRSSRPASSGGTTDPAACPGPA